MGKEERIAERKKRVPLGTHRMKLQADAREGYVRRWVNDEPGRLDMFKEAGYEFVTDPKLQVGEGDDISQRPGLGTAVSRHVGIRADNQPQRAYLMEIPEEYYKEDQTAKMQQVDEREDALRRGQDNQGAPGVDGRYVPKGTPIKIEHGKGPA